jgi:hypothetical protein
MLNRSPSIQGLLSEWGRARAERAEPGRILMLCGYVRLVVRFLQLSSLGGADSGSVPASARGRKGRHIRRAAPPPESKPCLSLDSGAYYEVFCAEETASAAASSSAQLLGATSRSAIPACPGTSCASCRFRSGRTRVVHRTVTEHGCQSRPTIVFGCIGESSRRLETFGCHTLCCTGHFPSDSGEPAVGSGTGWP